MSEERALAALSQRPPITFAPASLALGAAMVAVQLGTLSHEDAFSARSLIASGALFGPELWQGGWWRLFTATLVHQNPLQLILNLWFVMEMGRYGELRLGSGLYLVVFMVCALAGNAAGVLLRDPPLGGASPALMGTALAAGMTLWQAGLRPGTTDAGRRLALVYLLYFAACLLRLPHGLSALVGAAGTGGHPAVPLTSLPAQVAAVACGVMLGAALLLASTPRPSRALAMILLAFTLSGVASLVHRAESPSLRPLYLLSKAQVFAKEGKSVDARTTALAAEAIMYERNDEDPGRVLSLVQLWLTLESPRQAMRVAVEAAERHPYSSELVSLLAGLYLELRQGDPAHIIELHRRSLAVREDPTLLNNLAWLLLELDGPELSNPGEAQKLARKAAELDGRRNPAILHTLAEAEARLGHIGEAVALMRDALERSQRGGYDTGYYEDELRRLEKQLEAASGRAEGVLRQPSDRAR